MEKVISKVRRIVFVVFLLGTVIFIASIFHDNKIVAATEGNKILYNNETYIESFEVFDFEKDKCLGSVKIFENGIRHKMYSLHERPEYIYVDMWLDYRLYIKSPDA